MQNPAINDLRPISLLPFCAKIFEKLIFKNSKRMFIDNFGPHQYGFRPHSSTCNALISLHDHITSHCDSKGATGVEVIAFDFSKAFDKLNHNTILSRLFLCKFPIALIRWITSYFSNRTQHVCLGNWVSNIAQVTSGVPQGSILGPAILFALVMGCLQPIHPSSGLFIFADDVTISIPISSHCNNVVEEFNNVCSWSSTVKLSLNDKKIRRCISAAPKTLLLLSYQLSLLWRTNSVSNFSEFTFPQTSDGISTPTTYENNATLASTLFVS